MNAPAPKTNYRLVRLALAREAAHPAGDPQHSYRMVLPLTPDDRLDAQAYRRDPERCRVVREDPEGERLGQLVHGPGGRWSVRYGEGFDDDHGFRFELERFVPGEYVSISRDDGDRVYRVLSQQPA